LLFNLRKEKLNRPVSGKYQFIEHTADIAVVVTADSIEELFIAAAGALMESCADNVNFRSTEQKKINLNEYSLEELLVSFLNELNFFFSARKWILKSIDSLKIEEYEEIWQLKCVCTGGSDVEYEPKDEIKGVTFHQMEIKKDKGMFQTTIVFDI
jgi:SHS2 domain-containing protein